MKKPNMPADKQRSNNGKGTRDAHGRFTEGCWKKGQSGNPRGRTPKHDCITSLLKEEIEKLCPDAVNPTKVSGRVPKELQGKTWKELIVIATMRLAIKGNATALKECWERIDGKVPLPIAGVPDEEVHITVSYDR